MNKPSTAPIVEHLARVVRNNEGLENYFHHGNCSDVFRSLNCWKVSQSFKMNHWSVAAF